jgi:hypothetical protein
MESIVHPGGASMIMALRSLEKGTARPSPRDGMASFAVTMATGSGFSMYFAQTSSVELDRVRVMVLLQKVRGSVAITMGRATAVVRVG